MLGKLKCLFGFHDYGEPRERKRIKLSGHREDDKWVHESSGPETFWAEFCQRDGCLAQREVEEPEDG